MRHGALFGLAVLLGAAGSASSHDRSGPQPERPRLELRATPRMAFPPAQVFVVAELKGAAPGEEYYCPGLDWDWGDGTRSASQSDCPPWEDGSRLERLWSARHAYRQPGRYDVKLTLRRAERTVAFARVAILVHGGEQP